MKKTFEFNESEKYRIQTNSDTQIDKDIYPIIERIVSERITPEPKAMTEQEITNKEIYELECILEKVRKGGFMYTFGEAINDIENIFKPFMVQSAQITPKPGESRQSADEIEAILVQCGAMYPSKEGHPFYRFIKVKDGNVTLFNAISEAMRLHASQVCADKDREIAELTKQNNEGKELLRRWLEHDTSTQAELASLQSELSAANESLTVMLRENAELEKEVKEAYDKGVSVGRRDI